MILPLLAALLTALGPLLRGLWDLWAQYLIHFATIAGLSLWLSIHIFIGHIPLPSPRTLYWLLALAIIGAVSTWHGPIPGLSRPEWWNFLNALWIFPAMAALSKDQRSWIDEAIRVSGWILMTLAFYQHFFLHQDRPPSALVNQNIYAGAILMLLPLAVGKRDYLLAIGLLWNLAWTHSIGAWFGLSIALVLTQRGVSPVRFWIGTCLSIICAVIIYAKLGTPDVLHRWWWWKAAAHMAFARPLLGFGPGSFAVILPAYLSQHAAGLYSSYAHNYFLQTAAELGIPFCLIWSFGLWRCTERNSPFKRFGIISVCIQSLCDYTLSMPSNLWLFSYFCASSIPDNPEGVHVPARHRLPLILVVIALSSALCDGIWKNWRGHQALAEADAAMTSGEWEGVQRELAVAHRYIPDDPETPLHLAAFQVHQQSWLEAAASLEEAVRLNPYRTSTWTQLALTYRRLGRPELAQLINDRALRFQAHD